MNEQEYENCKGLYESYKRMIELTSNTEDNNRLTELITCIISTADSLIQHAQKTKDTAEEELRWSQDGWERAKDTVLTDIHAQWQNNNPHRQREYPQFSQLPPNDKARLIVMTLRFYEREHRRQKAIITELQGTTERLSQINLI